VKSGFGELDQQRQTDVPEPDHARPGATGFNLFQKGGGQR
jgi:hypothetical protein